MNLILNSKNAVLVGIFSFLSPFAYADFTGKVIHISDGDTVRVLDSSNTQHRIRLAGIDAPESKQAFGTKSKQALAAMIFSKDVYVKEISQDRYGRTVGQIYLNNVDINKEMVKGGWAWAYREYLVDKSYVSAEQAVKQKKLGLWADPNPIYPSQFRRSAK